MTIAEPLHFDVSLGCSRVHPAGLADGRRVYAGNLLIDSLIFLRWWLAGWEEFATFESELDTTCLSRCDIRHDGNESGLTAFSCSFSDGAVIIRVPMQSLVISKQRQIGSGRARLSLALKRGVSIRDPDVTA